MTDSRKSFFAWRVLTVVSLALLLFVLVIGSVKHETSLGKTVEQWHKDNPDTAENHLININTATPAELQQLQNMGEVTAQRIVAYRERFVRFSSIQELAQVKGVSEADVALWEPYITV